ncbi:MAG: ABC transporter ATP-binding protein [Kiritimatiellia bacterium]
MSSPPSKSTAQNMAVYRRLLRHARPYGWRLGLGVLFGVVFAMANGSFVWAINKGLPIFFGEQGSLQQIETPKLILALACFPLLALLRGLGDFGSKFLIKWVGNRVIMDLRNAMFRRLMDLSILFYSDRRTGELISRVTNDPQLVEQSVSTVLGDIVKEPLTLIVMVGSAIYLDSGLALVSLVLFPICLLPIVGFGRKMRKNSRLAQEKIADLMSILQETITGARIVKAYGMEHVEMARFAEQNGTFFGKVMRMARARASVEPIIVFISGIGIALVLLYARWKGMEFNEIMAFAAALILMYEPVKKLSGIHLQIQQSVSAAERIFELIDAPVTVAEKPGARPFDGVPTSVQFDRVEFCYGPETPVLKAVSLDVPAGTRLAIVGNSGSGKTTLVNLIPRFADVTGGAIRVNGVDIRDYTLKSLRKAMGCVTQDTILFNDTVAANIRYGTPEASLEEIQEAARKAYAHEFILAMPQGYDTLIGERGVRLSGGQKQRLAIARAILRNPPIMIMDEATSALDTASERQVQEALDTLMQGRTVFVIAHRLSTIVNCDRILVLDAGRIVESGTHPELLAKNGVYRMLYDLQFKASSDTG